MSNAFYSKRPRYLVVVNGFLYKMFLIAPYLCGWARAGFALGLCFTSNTFILVG